MNPIRFFHDLLIPKEENNFRAKALHANFLTTYLVLAMVLTFAFKHYSVNPTDVLGFATDITVAKLYELTNKVRSGEKVSNLSFSQKLSDAAYNKAQDMFNRNYWSHFAPDGTAPWKFVVESGYEYELAGENLAKNFLFSNGVVDAWMNSKTHRENLLRKDYTEVGFAVVNGTLNGEPTTLVVQMFGKPLPETAARQNSQIPKTAYSAPVVLAEEVSNPAVNLSTASFNIGAFFIVFLLVALVVDLYYATKMNVLRVTGKNIAHILFIGFVFLGLLLLTRGAII
jgi:uncharacterized protein YkwD